jgi:PAS domain-containing protein
MVRLAAGNRVKIEAAQWFAFVAIGLISLALIALIWTLTTRAIDDQAVQIRARTDQNVRSVAFVLAREIQDELQMVDQTLAIIQDAWKKDSNSVDLGQWRKQALALTLVARDIFIANQDGVIVQGTIPQSIGQGFGTAYVTYPNGSLEMFDPNGTKDADGRIATGSDSVEARQFLTYVLRPLERPTGWLLGASYRSEGITKFFSGAKLGQNGLIGLIAVKRGGFQAIVGSSARYSELDVSQSELIDQARKNDAGVWTGISPTDGVNSIIAYQRVPGRDMSVAVGIAVETANEPLAGLAAMSRGVAVMGSVVVLTIAGIVIWSIATVRAATQRQRIHERTELDLTHARQELTTARARGLLSEAEAGAIMSSPVDGAARLDEEQCLRVWNPRFAELAGVSLDTTARGTPVEDLLRRQASAGVFGDSAAPEVLEQEVSTRLTILHDSGQAMVPPEQRGPAGEQLTMHVRGIFDGGFVIMLVGPENARFAALPVLPGAASEAEPETADEATDW